MAELVLKAGSIVQTFSAKLIVFDVVFEEDEKKHIYSETQILSDVLIENGIEYFLRPNYFYDRSEKKTIKVTFLIKESDLDKATDCITTYLGTCMRDEKDYENFNSND